eukprot:Nitzschia sp. Nitz4//scaffold310_size27583//24182//24400//NITZ4_008180-RA/size27583-exonerate_est2genome-gene-0.13-mRNA-1//1//CDS//3329547367//4931//frame0
MVVARTAQDPTVAFLELTGVRIVDVVVCILVRLGGNLIPHDRCSRVNDIIQHYYYHGKSFCVHSSFGLLGSV